MLFHVQSLLMAIKARNGILLRFLYLLFLPVLSRSQTDTLLQGQLVKDGDDLVSAFGNFRLGFFSPRSTTKRYLGIWYQRPNDRVDPYDNQYYYYANEDPVWVANRNTPILDNESASLTIDSTDGNLKILHNGGNPVAVSSVKPEGNTSATLLKNGNFVLYEVNSDGSKGKVLWQSFDYPTDTLLPGMKLGIDLQTGHQSFLRSWISAQSPAEGSYVLGMDLNVTNKLVMWKGGKVHWTSRLMLNESLNLPIPGAKMYNFSFTSNAREIYLNYSANEDVTSFPELKIGTDGEVVDDMRRSILCTVFRGCSNDVCWRADDDFKVKYGFMDGDGLKFNETPLMTWSDCRARCLNNCSCVAFAPTNKSNYTGCQIWSRGIKFVESQKNEYGQIFLVVDPKDAEKKWWLWLIIIGLMALIACLLLSFGYLTRRKYKGREEKQWISFTVVLGATLVVPLFCYVCFLLLKKLKAKVQNMMNRKKLLRELGDNVSCTTRFRDRKTQASQRSMKHELNIFDFQTIADATNNFSATNRLGRGGFGPVYKGKLLDGQDIAIKRLSKTSGQGITEFKNEAKLIAKLQHTNLVRLLGCSLKGEERLLIYEYMPNKSLDFFIFDSTRKRLLNWKKRFNIIEGIAQGLLYLHKYSRLRVIHRDLKTSNILLDNEMNPKISDFGMARTFAMNQLETNTNRIVGTHGYMSPEYVMNGIVSMKSDVYSFGVLVLEIMSSKKNNSSYDTERPLNLVGYAWQLWSDGRGLELIDTIVDDSCSFDEVLRCIHVGLLCVQDRATDRPTMSDVISMLTNETMVLPAPKQPAFYINIPSDLEPEVTAIKLEIYSANDVTISDIEAR